MHLIRSDTIIGEIRSHLFLVSGLGILPRPIFFDVADWLRAMDPVRGQRLCGR